MATHAPPCQVDGGGPTFDCAVCYDTFFISKAVPVVPGDHVCQECFEDTLRAQFSAAVQHEHAYPVKWGAISLHPALFARNLPAGFVMKWTFRIREYNTPIKERIYCSHLQRTMAGSGFGKALSVKEIETAVDEERPMQECGKFLGARAPQTGARATFTCISCKGNTCGLCASSFFEPPTQHHCIDLIDKETKDAFEGMMKGKDYQTCPECAAPVELRDGCNHIFCEQGSCNATFCFICGEAVARREVEHWKKGRPCPRWNHPGARNAHHDPAPAIRRAPAVGQPPAPNAVPAAAPTVQPPGGRRGNRPRPAEIPLFTGVPFGSILDGLPMNAPFFGVPTFDPLLFTPDQQSPEILSPVVPQPGLFNQPPQPRPIPAPAPTLQTNWATDTLVQAAFRGLEAVETENINWTDRPQPDQDIAFHHFMLSGDILLNLARLSDDINDFPTVLDLRRQKEQIEHTHTVIVQREQEFRAALARLRQEGGFGLMDFRLSNGLFLYLEISPRGLTGIEERLGVLAAPEF